MPLPAPSPYATVIVTGASSGIGAEIARRLAALGYPLLLVARRRHHLDELAATLRQAHDVQIDVAAVDLADDMARAEFIDRIADRSIAGLCNCAGFGTNGAFHTLPVGRESEQINLNVTALTELTHAVLPAMVDRGSGAVVNIASLAGFQPIPGMAVYSATKAFVQTFSQAVHHELRGTGVSCTAVNPGPVPTEWAEIADASHLGSAVLEVGTTDVAIAAIRAMVKGRRMVIPGVMPKVVASLTRHAPRALLLAASARQNEKKGSKRSTTEPRGEVDHRFDLAGAGSITLRRSA